jgi:hypothetical protein
LKFSSVYVVIFTDFVIHISFYPRDKLDQDNLIRPTPQLLHLDQIARTSTGVSIWYPINQLNPATFLCLVQARTWISIDLLMFNDLRWEVIVRFVDIGGIAVHCCLNFLLYYRKIL